MTITFCLTQLHIFIGGNWVQIPSTVTIVVIGLYVSDVD